ncbi:MAG: hypothetical protein M4579_005642 [Chaenotheca gracillima]|nr:MAG: hypothetical protein M4579_005642 [Chaenotheca gracillima]
MSFPGRQDLPAFEDLPLRKGDPQISAWGLWDNSQLGSLNYLTDETVKKTAKDEIQTGIRVGLNLPLDFIEPAFLGRTPFKKEILDKRPKAIVNDDLITFNTQGSAQWDSFRHFAYQSHGTFYNGATMDDVHGDPKSTLNGLDAWAAKGIAGRGVLVDYYDWAQENGIKYDEFTNHPIPVEHVKKIIAEKKITINQGDIFFLRTGFVRAYGKLNQEDREMVSKRWGYVGLGQSEEAARWLWKSQFAAVVGDNVAFEASPNTIDPKWHMHPILLAGWGTPIGELFDLEALAATCKKLGRWTFFVSSAPLNYTGAVASPPNAIAFF